MRFSLPGLTQHQSLRLPSFSFQARSMGMYPVPHSP